MYHMNLPSASGTSQFSVAFSEYGGSHTTDDLTSSSQGSLSSNRGSPPLHSMESPPMQSPESPPLHSMESPPLHSMESPPLHSMESPPLQSPESPPLHSTGFSLTTSPHLEDPCTSQVQAPSRSAKKRAASKVSNFSHLENGSVLLDLGSGTVPKKANAQSCGEIIPEKKRQNHPPEATKPLKEWVADHVLHAYPSEEEKIELSKAANLTRLQVDTWFTNERRRNMNKYPNGSAAILCKKRKGNGRRKAKENKDPLLASRLNPRKRPLKSSSVSSAEGKQNQEASGSGLKSGKKKTSQDASGSIMENSETSSLDPKLNQDACVASGSGWNADQFIENSARFPSLDEKWNQEAGLASGSGRNAGQFVENSAVSSSSEDMGNQEACLASGSGWNRSTFVENAPGSSEEYRNNQDACLVSGPESNADPLRNNTVFNNFVLVAIFNDVLDKTRDTEGMSLSERARLVKKLIYKDLRAQETFK